MSWVLEYFVVYLLCVCIYGAYIYNGRLVMSSYVLFCCIYFVWCVVYHMLSKTRRNSRSLHRVIAYICYIYFDAWCITCCWGISTRFAGGGWWCKIPYSRCIFNTVVVVACVIFIRGFSRCRGYWIWVFCCLLFVMKNDILRKNWKRQVRKTWKKWTCDG